MHLVKQYKIIFRAKEGENFLVIEADSKEEAIEKSGLDSEIIKIQTSFSIASNEISADNQISILGALYSASISGQNVTETLVSTVELFYPKSTILNNAIQLSGTGLPISEILLQLKFNIVATKLVSAGELAGSLDSGIEEAEKYLELDSEVQAISKGGVVAAIPFLLIGAGMSLFYPIILGDVVSDLISEDAANIFTNILIGINVNLNTILLSIAGVIALIFYAKTFHWDAIKGFFPFSTFEALFLLQNAIVFLSIYSTLYRHGVEITQIIKTYASVNPKIAEQLSVSIEKGENFSTAIMACDFPEDWKKTTSSIVDFENKDAQNKAIEGLFTLLKKKINIQVKKSSGLISTLGKSLLLFALAMILVGFYFPAMMPK